MAWVRTPDELMEREEVFIVGLDALGLHIAALGYSNRNLTDGRIPRSKAAILVPLTDAGAVVERLVAAGWWTVTESGYQLVYLQDLQPSRAEVEAKREKTAQRQARFREQHAGDTDNGTSNGVTATVTNAPSRYPDPEPGPGSPDPEPEPALVPRSASGGAVAPAPAPPTKPRSLTPKRLAQIVDLVREAGVPIHPTSRDGGVLKSCAAPAELIAEAYVAAYRREWDPVGDGFLVGNLSLHLVIDRLAGYEAERRGADPARFVAGLDHLMHGLGHNVHGTGCDCRMSDAVAF